jgi:hypothetical protein
LPYLAPRQTETYVESRTELLAEPSWLPTEAAEAATTNPPEAPADEAINRDWKARWERNDRASMTRRPRDQFEAVDEPLFTKEAVQLHDGLTKAESSLLTQARTGKIGLRAFLFQRRVPDVITPQCSCGGAREMVGPLSAKV